MKFYHGVNYILKIKKNDKEKKNKNLNKSYKFTFLNMKFTCNKMENIKIFSSFDNVLIHVHVLSIDDCF